MDDVWVPLLAAVIGAAAAGFANRLVADERDRRSRAREWVVSARVVVSEAEGNLELAKQVIDWPNDVWPDAGFHLDAWAEHRSFLAAATVNNADAWAGFVEYAREVGAIEGLRVLPPSERLERMGVTWTSLDHAGRTSARTVAASAEAALGALRRIERDALTVLSDPRPTSAISIIRSSQQQVPAAPPPEPDEEPPDQQP